MAKVAVSFSGQSNTEDMDVNYYIFDSSYDANSYFAHSSPLPTGYGAASPLPNTTIGDFTKCQRATGLTQSTSWGCLTLSAYVVSYSVITQSGSGDDSSTESALANGAVHHLNAVAAMSPRGALPQPPGPSLNPAGLYGRLQSSFPDMLIPAGLSNPQMSVSSLTSPPPGLEEGHYIEITFSGSGADYSTSYINIDVFDNAQDAQAHYDSPPIFTGANGVSNTQTYDVLSTPSGFPAPLKARCRTYAVSASSNSTAEGLSSCFVLWGDVVIAAGTGQHATGSDSSPGVADNNMTITLARAALLFIAQSLAA